MHVLSHAKLHIVHVTNALTLKIAPDHSIMSFYNVTGALQNFTCANWAGVALGVGVEPAVYASKEELYSNKEKQKEKETGYMYSWLLPIVDTKYV